MRGIIATLINGRYGEIVRFGIVGALAMGIQYGLYLLLLLVVSPTLANTGGYLISFLFNYVASTRFTFHVKSTARRGAGFVVAHVVNYLLQTVFLNLFIHLGLSKQLALVPTLCVCVPINFLLVRFVLKRK